jgi:hypothetical protein
VARVAALEAAQQGTQQGGGAALEARVEAVEGHVAGLQEREGQLAVLLGRLAWLVRRTRDGCCCAWQRLYRLSMSFVIGSLWVVQVASPAHP